MAERSPILGYNHNISYRGLVFHVQTEDSGVANPHIFTHLFHKGVILTSRKLEYDREASDDAVKSLMQAQHKAVLKDLKRGTFDDKIDSYLSGNPDLKPREVADRGPITTPHLGTQATSASRKEKKPPRRRAASDISAAFQSMQQGRRAARATPSSSSSPRPKPRRHPTPIPQAPPPVMSEDSVAHIHSPAPTKATVESTAAPRRDITRPGVGVGVARGRPVTPSPPPVAKQEPASSNVLISRPPIVVDNRPGSRRGGPPPKPSSPRQANVGPRRSSPPPIPAAAGKGRRPAPGDARSATSQRGKPAARRPPARTVREEPSDGIFEQNLISEKSLDEVILAYLSEDSTEE